MSGKKTVIQSENKNNFSNSSIIISSSVYCFSSPKIAEFCLALRKGNMEIRKALERSKYKEISEDNMKKIVGNDPHVKKHSNRNFLSIAFYLSDLLGREEIEKIELGMNKILYRLKRH